MKKAVSSIFPVFLFTLLLISCKKPQISEHIVGAPWKCLQKTIDPDGSTVTSTVETTVVFYEDRTGTFGSESGLGTFVWDAPTDPNVEIYFTFDSDQYRNKQYFYAAENTEEKMLLEGKVYSGTDYVKLELELTR